MQSNRKSVRWECPKCAGGGCTLCENTGRYENYCKNMVSIGPIPELVPLAVAIDLTMAALKRRTP
jgi:hypothetical protein